MADGTLDKGREFDLRVKYTSADEGSTFPVVVWDVPAGKKLRVYDVIFGIQNKEATSIARAFLEVRKQGAWETLVQVGNFGKGFDRCSHNFQGRLVIETGGKINLRFAGNSTTYEIYVTVLGRLEQT